MSDIQGSWGPLPPGAPLAEDPEMWKDQRVPPGARVRGIGAFCDLGPMSSDSFAQSFSVTEFLRLDGGVRVALQAGRGFTIGWGAGDIESYPLTSKEIVDHVLITVLPDDEDPVEAHPWDDLAAHARARGIDTTAAQLRVLRYDVVLSQALSAWLAPEPTDQ